MDIKFDGDIAYLDGDLKTVNGAEKTAQQAQAALMTVAGEWWADESLGLNMQNWSENPELLEHLVRNELAQFSEIAGVEFLSTNISARKLSAQINITLKDGQTARLQI